VTYQCRPLGAAESAMLFWHSLVWCFDKLALDQIGASILVLDFSAHDTSKLKQNFLMFLALFSSLLLSCNEMSNSLLVVPVWNN